MKIHLYRATGLIAAGLMLAACGNSTSASPAKEVNDAVAPTQVSVQALPTATEPPVKVVAATKAPADTPTPAPIAAEAGGENGGEAPLVPYADIAQGFSIDYPKPWSKDPAVKDGVKFDGDGSMTLAFVKPDIKDAMAFATADAKTLATSHPSFKQVGLDASTEVPNAIVLGFDTTGTSNVTGKPYAARGDRYYIALKDGRIAVLTVISPVKNYDREGVRDIALTLKVTK